MGRRPWSCYRKHIDRKPYIKKRGPRGKEFVHGGADPKIRIFDMGNTKKEVSDDPSDFDAKIGLQVMHTVMVSDGTLESVRTSINRYLRKFLGRLAFHLKIRAHPYRVYRENKMMAFAGADRLQSGMRASFGKPIGRMAKVKAGQIIAECSVKRNNIKRVKKAFKTAKYKIPTTCRLVLLEASNEDIREHVGLIGPNQA